MRIPEMRKRLCSLVTDPEPQNRKAFPQDRLWVQAFSAPQQLLFLFTYHPAGSPGVTVALREPGLGVPGSAWKHPGKFAAVEEGGAQQEVNFMLILKFQTGLGMIHVSKTIEGIHGCEP